MLFRVRAVFRAGAGSVNLGGGIGRARTEAEGGVAEDKERPGDE